MSAGSPLRARPGFPLLMVAPAAGWLLATRGVAAVAFGVLTLLWPGITVLTLAILFGAYILVDGIGLVVEALRGHGRMPRGARIAAGLLGVVVGILALALPGVTVRALAVLVGIWAVVSGVSEVAAVLLLHGRFGGTGFVILGGVLSIIAGTLVLGRPEIAVFAISVIIGAYSLVYGLLLLWFAVWLRSAGGRALPRA